MISVPSQVPQKILDYVKEKRFLTTEDLTLSFGFRRATAHNYLSRLKKMGIISRIGYGKYRVGKYVPPSTMMTQKVAIVVNAIKEKMPYAELTAWSTENLARFSHYAIGKDVIFIETHKGTSMKIRDILLENGIRSLVGPSRREMGNIFSLLDEPLVIFQRKETYATETQGGSRSPFLERMLVDLYFYITRLDFPYPLDEYGRVLHNALRTCTLNTDMLRKYASRRGLREEVSILLSMMKNRYPDLRIPELEEGLPETEAILDEIVKGASS